MVDYSFLLCQSFVVKTRFLAIPGICLLMVGGMSSVALANGSPPAATAIVACTDGNRATVVCFDVATITRGVETFDAADGDFTLTYQDESTVFGPGSAEFTLRVQFNGDPTGPLAGDVGEFTITYPAKNSGTEGDGSDLRGEDLSAGVFAITNAADFTFIKTLKTLTTDPEISYDVLEFVIDKTYVEMAGRVSCGFLEGEEGDEFGNKIPLFDADTGFGFPSPECETPNSEAGNLDSDSFVYVPDNISFYATGNDLFGAEYDNAYLNYQGAGVSWFIEPSFVDSEMGFQPGAFQFQLIGPKFAAGENLNTGAVQVFIPQPAMEEIFGGDFTPGDPFQAVRVDAEPGVRTVQDLVTENAVTSQNLRGGLLIEVPSYGFSAPAFSFASTDRAPITALSPGSPGGGAGSAAAVAGASAALPELAATGAGDNWMLFGLGSTLLVALGALMVSASIRGRNQTSL